MRGDASAETCVIGGGLAGVATALDLAERGRPVVLLEARRIAWGASGRNGGFVSDGFQLEEEKLERWVGPHEARAMRAMTRDARDLLRARIARERVGCGPMPRGIMRVAFAGQRAGLQAWRDRLERDHGARWTYWPRERVREALATSRYADAVVSEEGFAVDPLAMTRGLADAAALLGAAIHEDTRVLGVERAGASLRVRTARGVVHCRHVVVACGGHVERTFPALRRAVVPVATFVAATPPLGERLSRAIATPHAVFDLQFATNYYRRVDGDRLLWGGRVLGWQLPPARIARQLGRDIGRIYPGLREVPISCVWGGWMGFLRHRMPVIGQTAPGEWVATGFGGHGLALTTMAGRLLGEAIAGESDRWRLFARFGLPFSGGRASRFAAQPLFWAQAVRDRASRGGR